MPLKDYYSILGVDAGAHLEEIKRAYRKLALVHHPDRNRDDPYAAAYFHEIREAYETLTDPIRKDHYLQQRWYSQAIGKKLTVRATTPETVLNDAIQLNKYVHSLNPFRIDKPGLAAHINNLLNEDTVYLLEKYNSTDTNKTICKLVLDCLDPLESYQTEPVIFKLRKISKGDAVFERAIDEKIRRKSQRDAFERYKVWLILLLTIAICLVIWLS